MAAAASSSSSSGAEAAESGMTIALANSRMIALMSNDGDIFWVTEASARQSKLIEDMIVSGVITHPYELPSVDAETLKAVIEYCDEHGNNNSDTDEERKALRDFDVGFRGKLDGDKGLLIKIFTSPLTI
uniref:SKP1 component POZ domain-containing protein n=1 Tax=Leersia perrieri TaxID=77586 RepID=A0A0D9X1S3_9ORYZ